MKTTTIIKPKDAGRTRYPLPKSLVDAAGMLKGRLPNALKYQREIRKGWEQRIKKTERTRRGGV